jgi:hypothetical protein
MRSHFEGEGRATRPDGAQIFYGVDGQGVPEDANHRSGIHSKEVDAPEWVGHHDGEGEQVE